MNKESTILVTGASGMVGKNLVKRLLADGFHNILTPTSKELDLTSSESADAYFAKHDIDYVFHLAAKVGGIAANIESPADFLNINLKIASTIITVAHARKVKKMLLLGSSCIYPRNVEQPMKEESILTGILEPTNEGYAIAKIAQLKLAEYYNKQYGTNFISLMPCNLYGEYDHFDTKNSHVMSALITRFTQAKENKVPVVEIWGTGVARREFLHVTDVADAMVFFMNRYDAKELPPFINIGLGTDVSIKELAEIIKKSVGYEGNIVFDTSKPDGMPKKLLDVQKAKNLGWEAKIAIEEGIQRTVAWYNKEHTK